MTTRSLKALERQLLSLGASVPNPALQKSTGAVLGCLLAHRGHALYRGLLLELGGPVPVTAVALNRPLVELAIVLKWISLNPALHGELWLGQSEESELRFLRRMVETELHAPLTTEEAAAVAEKVALRDAARARAKAAERKDGERIAPTTARMVDEIVEADPGHTMAMRGLALWRDAAVAVLALLVFARAANPPKSGAPATSSPAAVWDTDSMASGILGVPSHDS